MKHHPVVSVITATYNRKHTLRAVYEGLLLQTFIDFEWIIVDDGSIDGTSELVAKWKPSFPIVYKYMENGGRPSAVNFGLTCAKGKYLVCLDSDDVPVPEIKLSFLFNFPTSFKCALNLHPITIQYEKKGFYTCQG